MGIISPTCRTDAGQQSLWMRQVAIEASVQTVPASSQPFVRLTFLPDGNFVHYVRNETSLPTLRSTACPCWADPKKVLFDLDTPVSFSPEAGKGQFAFVRGDPVHGRMLLMIANTDRGGLVRCLLWQRKIESPEYK